METFVLDSSRWQASETSKCASRLLAEDGKFCCLGLYGKFKGASDEYLEDVPTPRRAYLKSKSSTGVYYLLLFTESGITKHLPETINIMNINDCVLGTSACVDGTELIEITTYEEKESLLREQFAKLGINLEFTEIGRASCRERV